MFKVAVLMGSISDRPVADKALEVLKAYGVRCEARVCSAHRTPDAAAAFARGGFFLSFHAASGNRN